MIPQITIQPNNNNTTSPTIPTITNNTNNTTNPTIPTITITPPQNKDNHTSTVSPAIPPPLRHSPRLLACQTNATDKIHFAFLSEFLLLCDTHDLFPLHFTHSNFASTESFLSSLSDGSMEPIFDTSDDPSWSLAICSPECEYWIARAREELRNLADLQVFVPIPHSDTPCGRRLLKGKLVCKRKWDDAGHVVRYKVCYVAKGYAQQYGVDYDKTTA